MRKKILAVLATAAFLTPAVFAQHTPPSPANVVQHLLDRLTKEGVIDTSQQASASTCFLPAVTSNASVETMLRADHKQLDTDLAADNLGAIENDITAISTLEAEIPGNNSAALVCLVKLLNPTELAKLAQGRGIWGLTPGPGGPRGGPGGFGGRGPQ